MVMRFREWLRDEDIVDEHLLSDLKAIEAFGMNRDAVGCAFCDGKVYRSIALALNRQYRLTRGTDKGLMDCLVFERGLGTIARMGLCVQHSICRLTETLQGGMLVLALMAVGIEIRLRSEWDVEEQFQVDPLLDDAGYFLYIKDLLHPVECKEPHCYREKTDEFMGIFKPRLEAMWIPFKTTILIMADRFCAPDVIRRMINLWDRLCNLMHTTEDSVRLKRMKEGLCLNWMCEKYDYKNPYSGARKTKGCSRCKLAKYCSVECQKQDWATHREECNPLSLLAE
ncbi:uncharacterized protein PHACADRAFT_255661 [Phanerochaete carnosa HHB-10118-sp]|uniref:MYND-type domain-containing protein n=1 Tax=Phanerochaete carnosa (strain HHB-10118-sp) TaxID=650164 RepID=K5W8A0_PHACS|nr:uncharacterized protein PHACADRAFT_255661 [Phanerochaete carnosa HHB-10118-sp]EKM55209.1 hypothetical protein PHACADRAFT_255661 [Phanerochaete carnosa HHB-10118-sp]